jgi:hypothetical protein
VLALSNSLNRPENRKQFGDYASDGEVQAAIIAQLRTMPSFEREQVLRYGRALAKLGV